jgi:hypothetical protein
MAKTEIRDKHLKLDQKKIDKARKILGTETETETIERALDVLAMQGTIEKALEMLLAKSDRLQFRWAGALNNLSDKTSVQLQHEINEMRSDK